MLYGNEIVTVIKELFESEIATWLYNRFLLIVIVKPLSSSNIVK